MVKMRTLNVQVVLVEEEVVALEVVHQDPVKEDLLRIVKQLR